MRTNKKSSTSIELLVFRHGQTDWNAEGRIQGHLDVPLNDVGRLQARELIGPLRRLGVQAFLSSDLCRARDTAAVSAAALGLSLCTDEGLREIHLGKMQGLTKAEIEEKFGVEFSDRIRHTPLTDSDVLHLGSESGDQVILRAREAIHRFVLANPEFSRIGICSHGGVVRRLIQTGSADGAFPPPTPNGVLYPFEYRIEDGNLRFLGVNRNVLD